MAFSPLTDQTMTTKKHSSRKGKSVIRVLVHHWAGTRGGVERLVHSTDQASANYIILNDGTLIGSVDEIYRAWTSGSWEADAPSITVEIQNETLGPDWRVSGKAIHTLTRLIADIAKRHGWKSITRTQVRGHQEFAATACPGPYLYPRLAGIASDAEEIRKGGLPVSGGGQSAPAPSKPTPPPAKPSGKTVEALAAEVIAGRHGTGAARKKALGSQYAAVQAEVNRQLRGKTPAKPAAKSISTLAIEVIAGKHGTGDTRRKALGSRYAAVQAEVNRRLGGKPKAKSVGALAVEVIAGQHGTGAARKKSLGAQYGVVQAEVNRRLKGK